MIKRFGEHAKGWTCRVTWNDRPPRLIRRLVETDVTILSVRGRGGRWKFRLLSPDRDVNARANDIMDNLDCAAECFRVSSFGGGDKRCPELSDEQREALVEAFAAGYYDIPRGITSKELAERLGISHQALSERFRQAHEQLIDNGLVIE